MAKKHIFQGTCKTGSDEEVDMICAAINKYIDVNIRHWTETFGRYEAQDLESFYAGVNAAVTKMYMDIITGKLTIQVFPDEGSHDG